MKPVSQSIWYLLTHSIISLVAILVLTAVFVFFQVALSIAELEPKRAFQAALMINLTLSGFLGVYLGGALLKLKQNYLWQINQRYRSSIMAAYLIIIGVFSVLQLPFFTLNIEHSYAVLLAPFCITIFASQMVLGKNALHKILIPAFPYLIVQLHLLEVSANVIMLLIIISTLALMASMYLNRFYPDNVARQQIKDSSSIAMTSTSVGFGPSVILSINHYIGLGVASWVRRSKKNIDWAVLMPHTKLGLASIFYMFIIVLFVLFAGDKDKPLIEPMSILFVSTSLIMMVMESRHLIRQTRFFAHVFSGDKHRQLKSKILFSVNRTFIINCSIFVAGILLLARGLSMEVNTPVVIYSVLAIVLIGFATSPALLCISWVNIAFPQAFMASVYFALIFMATRWINENIDQVLSSFYTVAFIVGCCLLRGCTQVYFWNTPIEKLLKNK